MNKLHGALKDARACLNIVAEMTSLAWNSQLNLKIVCHETVALDSLLLSIYFGGSYANSSQSFYV